MSVYLARTNSGALPVSTADDTLFVNQRFDGEPLADAKFVQCTFANVSFKDADLRRCVFSACVFEGCYFRETKIRDCHFPATRFLDCEFIRPKISGGGFAYSRFVRSVPPYDFLELNLPQEPNLCRDLTANLASEASHLGMDKDARRYRLRSIEEAELSLSRGWRWKDEYAETHFRTGVERARAWLQLAGSRLNGVIWGHGERIRRLLGSLAVVAGFLGPLLLFLARDHLHAQPGREIVILDYWTLSVASIVNSPGVTQIDATGVAQWIVLAESGTGLLFLGLFVTYVFRAVTRR
ncbi:MAG: pentapeptide repeat-containing protein [Actinomycetota bacterium]|nr:pentapeptide repeat-containing protein [Actinomycetota bacterium]